MTCVRVLFLSFMAVVIQIPCGFGLQWILDNKRWDRRRRALIGLTTVAVPLVAAWIWETIRVKGYDRHNPPTNPTDWSDPEFGWIFVPFMLTWISCSRCGNMSSPTSSGPSLNTPMTLAHYAGVFRGVLGAGEAICFGLDSIQIPFIDEASGVFALYCAGIITFYYLAWFHIDDSNYFKDEIGAVVPNHILREKGLDGQVPFAGGIQNVVDEVPRKI